MARQGQHRVWAAGLAGSKVCPQLNADSLLSPHSSQLHSLPVTLGDLRGLWCNPTSPSAARVSLSIVVHTHTSPASPPSLVTWAHTQPNTHTSELSPSADQASLLPGRAHRQSPAPALGDHRARSGWGCSLVNSGTSERPQVSLHILRVLPGALAANPPRELSAQGSPGRCYWPWRQDLGSSLHSTCKRSDLGQGSTPAPLPGPGCFKR